MKRCQDSIDDLEAARYDAADLDEKRFELGSRRRLLKNPLGIASIGPARSLWIA